MKTKILGEKMVAQYPVCRAIKMETNNKYQKIIWQKSIAIFDNLQKEPCFVCQNR